MVVLSIVADLVPHQSLKPDRTKCMKFIQIVLESSGYQNKDVLYRTVDAKEKYS
jgi:hypothetical protein